MRSRAAAESRRPVLLLVCSTVFFRLGLADRNNPLPLFALSVYSGDPALFLCIGFWGRLWNQTNLATSVEHFVSAFLSFAFSSVKNKSLHDASGIHRFAVFKAGAEFGPF